MIHGHKLILGQHREPISGDTRLTRSNNMYLNSRHMIHGLNSREDNSHGPNSREDTSHGDSRLNRKVVIGQVNPSKVRVISGVSQ